MGTLAKRPSQGIREPPTLGVTGQEAPRRHVLAPAFKAKTMGFSMVFRNTYGTEEVSLAGSGRQVSPS